MIDKLALQFCDTFFIYKENLRNNGSYYDSQSYIIENLYSINFILKKKTVTYQIMIFGKHVH